MIKKVLQKYKIDQVYYFGETKIALTHKDVSNLRADYTNQYHLLRHYRQCPAAYLATLVGNKYRYFDYSRLSFCESTISQADLEIALQTKGTKFKPNVPGLETPKALVATIKVKLRELVEKKQIVWIKKAGREMAAWIFDYPVVVGRLDLREITTLSLAEKLRIKKVPRSEEGAERSLLIQTVSGISPKPTKQIAVELNKIAGHINVSAWPGNLSPDFPNPKQTKEELAYTRKYWANHVFVD